MVVIRLARGGSNKNPFYHVVAADKRFPLSGRYLECLGFFNPVARGKAIKVDVKRDRIDYWLQQGAKMSDTVKELVRQGSLTSGHARALLSAKNPLQLANEVIKGGLSVRQTENLVKTGSLEAPAQTSAKSGGAAQKQAVSAAAKDANLLKLEANVSSLLGLKVSINQSGTQSGAISIAYQSLDQLEDVLKRLSVGAY